MTEASTPPAGMPDTQPTDAARARAQSVVDNAAHYSVEAAYLARDVLALLDELERTRAERDGLEDDEPYDPPCGNPECEEWHCGRCAAHNAGQQGHYAAFCQVTKARAPHHFCCPGDCEQAAPVTATPDPAGGEQRG